MLVLTRKQNETFWINDDVRIEIKSVNGRIVKVGIDAPSSVKITRGEVKSRQLLEGLKSVKNANSKRVR